jgi:hypothetical protein
MRSDTRLGKTKITVQEKNLRSLSGIEPCSLSLWWMYYVYSDLPTLIPNILLEALFLTFVFNMYQIPELNLFVHLRGAKVPPTHGPISHHDTVSTISNPLKLTSARACSSPASVHQNTTPSPIQARWNSFNFA